MKSHNRMSIVAIALVMAVGAILGGCATVPEYQPETFQGEVTNNIARSGAPEVGDTGHVGHINFVYSTRGWVRT